MSRRFKNKILRPFHPWRKERIKVEKQLMKKYGLRRNREIWRMNYILSNFKNQAKALVVRMDAHANVEAENLFGRLKRLNIVQGDVSFDDVLALKLEDILERRLQTVVVRNSLARTMMQARQMIVHGHIAVGGKVVTSCSYLVKAKDEASIAYAERSPFSKPDHPELNVNLGKEIETPEEITAEENAETVAAEVE